MRPRSLFLATALATGALVAWQVPAPAATPAPRPASNGAAQSATKNAAAATAAVPKRVNVEQLQPKELLPKKALHVEYTVEVNRLGQIARVRTVKPSHDQAFDAKTYGNTLQAFIRTPDGKAISGLYRLTYDYDPKTTRVKRDVALLRAGGVDPNAHGAVNDMMEIARRNINRTPPPAASPAATLNPKRLPDLPQVMKTSSPR